MTKFAASRDLIIKINISLLVFFLLMYVILLGLPSFYDTNSSTLVRCNLRDCYVNKDQVSGDVPSLFTGLQTGARIATVNMEEEEEEVGVGEWQAVRVEFERVSGSMEWKHLFPEWIDEEEEYERLVCPEIPMPDFSTYGEVDVVVARLPCRKPEKGWARDPFRLQVHLVVMEMAARKGRRNGQGKVRVVVASACQPMMEILRCDDLVKQEGEWWEYEADVGWLEEKLRMPVGSCKLALPLWIEGTNEAYEASKLAAPATIERREAYATVLHSSSTYICGAIMLAHSIITAGTTRDLILLHDKSIPPTQLMALAAAGWQLRLIKRIRNPQAKPNTYNEYNYSKLRLWQLTDYDKIVFVDADIVLLRSLDHLFHFPQLSAVGNDGVIFNSGVMVIEPSKCTFKALVDRRKDVVSYNGGDQGFLNEVLVWWHRLPRRVNFLKNFWSNTTEEEAVKNKLFEADPPELYAIHYLGLKPWFCYRDYDCNFNVGNLRVYASDVAHWRWWRVHDEMEEGLKTFCTLPAGRKEKLERDRNKAAEMEFADGHWKLEISDKRREQ